MFCLLDNTEENKEKYDKYILYENETYIFLPRLISNFIKNNKYIYQKDNNFIPSTIDGFKFTSILNDQQKYLMDEIINIYNENGFINGVFHLRCGIGKTVCSIYISSILNKKSLVVISMGKILEQWKEEFLKHSDLKEEDIGLIKGNVFDVENKKIIITTPQTLASKIKNDYKSFYLKFRDLGIDLIFFDECHQLGQKYVSSTLLFNTKNIIGLSATPYLVDEKEVLFKSIFNDTLIKNNNYDYIPTIKFYKYNSGLGKENGYKLNFLQKKNFILGKSRYDKLLLSSETQLNSILEITKKESVDGNRIIIICNTVKQLELIYNKLVKENLSPTKLYSKKNVIDKENDKIIIAIYKYASLAFDYKELNRLILSIPLLGKKSLIQSIGRILRKCEGKTDTIVYDLIDIDKEFNGLFLNSIKNKINILKSEYNECEFIE